MVPQITFSSELLVMLAGTVLSLGFSYIPKLNTWFAEKSSEFKQLTMLLIMFVMTGIVFALGCGNLIQIESFVCDKNTAVYFIYVFLVAVISNQTTYMITPKTNGVKQALDTVQGDELYKG